MKVKVNVCFQLRLGVIYSLICALFMSKSNQQANFSPHKKQQMFCHPHVCSLFIREDSHKDREERKSLGLKNSIFAPDFKYLFGLFLYLEGHVVLHDPEVSSQDFFNSFFFFFKQWKSANCQTYQNLLLFCQKCLLPENS